MKFILVVAFVAAYAVASLWLMLYATTSPWAVLAIFAPLIVGFIGVALKKRHWPSLLGALAVGGGLVLIAQQGSVGDVQKLYLLQHVVLHLLLAFGFGITLRPGGTALISAMAAPLHRDFTPAMRDYTRRLTGLWVVYFVAIALLSVLLYSFAPWSWWSLFANLLTPIFAVCFFLGEIPVRYWLHPEFERSTLKQMVTAWQTRHGAEEPR